jgi:hypothetical protein
LHTDREVSFGALSQSTQEWANLQVMWQLARVVLINWLLAQ